MSLHKTFRLHYISDIKFFVLHRHRLQKYAAVIMHYFQNEIKMIKFKTQVEI